MSGQQTNNLFPIFLKLEQLNLVIVGGGFIALEKLNAVLDNSPNTKIKLIGSKISQDIKDLTLAFTNVTLLEKKYHERDLEGADLVIAAVGDITLAEEIQKDAKKMGILINAADKPALCDFYLGSIVRKGDLKIAISTNGKSPTMAKRVKETLNDVFPEETQEVLENLFAIRENLKGDFAHKVKTLNHITKELTLPKEKVNVRQRIRIAALYSIAVIILMIIGHLILSYVPISDLKDIGFAIAGNLDSNFWLYALGGFVA